VHIKKAFIIRPGFPDEPIVILTLWWMSLYWLTRFRDSSLFHCDHIEPETDGQAINRCWFENTQRFGVVTQGEESMVTENHPKRGEKSKKVQ